MQAPLPFSDRVDMKTMGNKTWTSLAGTGLPAAEKFSVPKVGEFSELVGQGKGKVGNRVGESPLSYKTAFKKNEQRTMKNGKPFESRCTQPAPRLLSISFAQRTKSENGREQLQILCDTSWN